MRDIRRIQQATELHRLIVALQQAPDLAAAEQLVKDAAQQASGQ